MALIEIHADLTKLTQVVERIAQALERAYPPPGPKRPAHRATLEDVTRVTNDTLLERELDRAARNQMGLAEEERG